MNDPRDWDLEYDGAAPPLPREMERKRRRRRDRHWAELVERLLPRGSYLVWFEPRIPEEFEPSVSVTEGLRFERLYCGVFRILHRPEPLESNNRLRRFLENSEPLLSSGSGDLYCCDKEDLERFVARCKGPSEAGSELTSDEERLEALPFKRTRYRYYLRAETLWLTEKEASSAKQYDSRLKALRAQLGARWSLIKQEKRISGLVLGLDTRYYDGEEGEWQCRQPLTLRIETDTAAQGGAGTEGKEGENLVEDLGRHGRPDEYRASMVYNSLGTVVGMVRLARISHTWIRQAVIQLHRLDCLDEESVPNDPDRWKDTFGPAGWNVRVSKSIRPIPEEFGERRGGWSPWVLQEYHQGEIGGIEIEEHSLNPQGAPEAKWTYHVLTVDRMQGDMEGNCGYMYDIARHAPPDDASLAGGQREGAAVAWETVRQEAVHGGLEAGRDAPGQGQQGGSGAQLGNATASGEGDWKGLLHWVAQHEFGHMLGLYHNPSERSLMQPRRYRNREFNPQTDFKLAEADLKRLWHLPDLWVRPGGVPFCHRYRGAPVSILDLIPAVDGLKMEVYSQVLFCGESLTKLKCKVQQSLGDSLPLPGPRSCWPDKGRVAVTLNWPDGRVEVLLPEQVPREVKISNEDLMDRETGVTIPLTYEFNQVGFYWLEVHLFWVVRRDSRGRFPGRIFRAQGKARIRVV